MAPTWVEVAGVGSFGSAITPPLERMVEARVVVVHGLSYKLNVVAIRRWAGRGGSRQVLGVHWLRRGGVKKQVSFII